MNGKITPCESISRSNSRAIAARENGREGGYGRASCYSEDVLSEWASRGGPAVLLKYGREYFAELRKRRKNYPKNTESPVIEPNWRSIAAKQNGQKGGIARAAFYGPDWIREWGRLGGIETRSRHGAEFYREIRSKRKYYKKKGYQTRKTKVRWQKECERLAREERNPAIALLWLATAKHFGT
jgi:hypothetical protein